MSSLKVDSIQNKTSSGPTDFPQGSTTGGLPDTSLYFATKAAANAALASIPNGAYVIVEADESASPAGVRVRYQKQSGSLVVWMSTNSSQSTFTQAGIGAVARSVQSKLREIVSVDDFGAVGDGVTDDTTAAQTALSVFATGQQNGNASFRAQKVVRFTSGKTYLINATTTFNSLNGVTIEATGAVILFNIDGPGFDFQSCNYPRIKGGFWVILQDTPNAEAFKLTRTKFADIADLEIASDNSGNDALNRGFSLHAPGAGINDVTAYNEFRNIRINRLGKSYELRDDTQIANGASRVLLNQFNHIESQCANGPVYVAAVNNYFIGDFETASTGIALTLTNNVNNVGSSENGFDLLYLAGARTVVYGVNCQGNTFVDRHGSNSQNQARSTGTSIFGGNDSAYIDLNDFAMGGVRRIQPANDNLYSMGGLSGINLLPYSNDFTKWAATNCTATPDTALTDPDGNYSPNGRSYTLTQTAANGFISMDTAVLGNATRHVQFSGRVWMYSVAGGTARLLVEQRSFATVRTLFQRTIYLPAGKWVLAMAGMKPTDSGSADFYRMYIYPTQNGGTGEIKVFEAGLYKGFAKAHMRTNGLLQPRGFNDGLIGENLAAAQGLYLGGLQRENAMRAVLVGSDVPTTGKWFAGDIVFNTAPVAGGKVGWVCTTSGQFGTLASDVRATTTAGSATITVATSVAGLAVDSFITIAGVTGTKRVVSISGAASPFTVVLDSAADASVTGAQISNVTPVFKLFGQIDP